MQYQLQTPDGQVLAALDMTVASRLTTYLNTQAHLNISDLLPQTVDEPQGWTQDPAQVQTRFEEAQSALNLLEAQLPPPGVVTTPGFQVSKALADLTPEESALLQHIPHTSETRDERAWVTFEHPGEQHMQQMAAAQDLAQARADLATVSTFFQQAGQTDPQPQLVLCSADAE